MDCAIDLCHCDNPHGFCNSNSCLFYTWLMPLAFITCPIWFPIVGTGIICTACVERCLSQYQDAKEWSDKHRNKYEVVET